MSGMKPTTGVAFAIALFFASPGSAQQPFTISPSDAPQESAAYDSCLVEVAATYDDRISDAQTVAKVVANECRYRQVLFIEALLRARPELNRGDVYQALQGKLEMDSLKAVLKGRR